jgi:energy-converting hydrogenase A subunit M
MHSIYAEEQSVKNYLSNSVILKSSSGALISDLQKFIEIFSQNLEISSIRKVFSFTK